MSVIRRMAAGVTIRFGDIDAWEGDRLVISAEVKHFEVDDGTLAGLTHFASSVGERAALGLVVATGFQASAKEAIEALGLIPLSHSDILRIVSLWDPLKQRAALNAFQWVVAHKEQNSGLIERVKSFLASVNYGTVLNQDG